MKKTVFLLCLFVFLSCSLPQAVFARALSPQDKQKIECAQFKMLVLGNFFDVTKSVEQKNINIPPLAVRR